MTSVAWIRRDARLDDNPVFSAAAEEGPVCALFVIDPKLFERCSARRRDLLVAGLSDLDRRLQELGGRLRVERGDPDAVVPRVVDEIGADSVHINSEITPYGVERDRSVAEAIQLVSHEGIYASPPGSILTNDGNPYKVFTPFFDKWSAVDLEPDHPPDQIDLLDHPGEGLPRAGEPIVPAGETAAFQRLEGFLGRVDDYDDERDRIDLDKTSQLSVDLKYGWIGPRRVVSCVGSTSQGRRAFVRQIAWRDFYGHVMAETPNLVDESMDPRYRDIGWNDDPDDISAWKRGRTGYPLVDAAVRKLVSEGTMHNRARMIVASFLVKDLLVDWRVGERFFRHHLIDGDVAQNAGNWQWVAGTGTDAAPYFRVLNPVAQSQRFDPEGRFIRRWVPELAVLSDAAIHAPWESPEQLDAHGIELGKDYPAPIVDHATARQRAMDAYESGRRSL